MAEPFIVNQKRQREPEWDAEAAVGWARPWGRKRELEGKQAKCPMPSSLTQMYVAPWYPRAQHEWFHITFLPEPMDSFALPSRSLFPLRCLDISASIFLPPLIFFFNPHNMKQVFISPYCKKKRNALHFPLIKIKEKHLKLHKVPNELSPMNLQS